MTASSASLLAFAALAIACSRAPEPPKKAAAATVQNAAGEDVCRVPFSVASLLEVNAMYEEMKAFSDLLGELDDNDRIVETGQFSQKTLEMLYDPLSFRLGASISVLGLVAAALTWAYTWRRSKAKN